MFLSTPGSLPAWQRPQEPTHASRDAPVLRLFPAKPPSTVPPYTSPCQRAPRPQVSPWPGWCGRTALTQLCRCPQGLGSAAIRDDTNYCFPPRHAEPGRVALTQALPARLALPARGSARGQPRPPQSLRRNLPVPPGPRVAPSPASSHPPPAFRLLPRRFGCRQSGSAGFSPCRHLRWGARPGQRGRSGMEGLASAPGNAITRPAFLRGCCGNFN